MRKTAKSKQAMEELFRVPIFESGSQHSVIEDYSAEEENDGQSQNPKSSISSRSKTEPGVYLDESSTDNEKTEYRQQMLSLLQGKQGLAWARKLFFLSTEMMFPGFVRSAEAQNRIGYYMGVRVRSSCLLQSLLYADVYFFLFWLLSFGFTFDITTSVLKELHGYLFICLAVLFSIINVGRIRFGFWGNDNDEVQYLALYWMTTTIVELPLLGFIVFTDVFSPVVLPYIVTMDSIMLTFIFLESVVGFHHFNNLLRDEIKIIRMARRTENLLRNRAATAHLRPKVTNTVQGPHIQWVPKEGLSDDAYSSSEESVGNENNVASTSVARKNTRNDQPQPSSMKLDYSHQKSPLHESQNVEDEKNDPTDSSESSLVNDKTKDVDVRPTKEGRKKKV